VNAIQQGGPTSPDFKGMPALCDKCGANSDADSAGHGNADELSHTRVDNRTHLGMY
jgi:hypothetical protein